MSIDIEVKVYKYNIGELDIFFEYLDNYNLFRNPTITERCLILEHIINTDDVYGDIILIDMSELNSIKKV